MANYYLDFVGLNTFIYEPVGYDISQQTVYVVEGIETITYGPDFPRAISQNQIGIDFDFGTHGQLLEYKNLRFSHRNMLAERRS